MPGTHGQFADRVFVALDPEGLPAGAVGFPVVGIEPPPRDEQQAAICSRIILEAKRKEAEIQHWKEVRWPELKKRRSKKDERSSL